MKLVLPFLAIAVYGAEEEGKMNKNDDEHRLVMARNGMLYEDGINNYNYPTNGYYNGYNTGAKLINRPLNYQYTSGQYRPQFYNNFNTVKKVVNEIEDEIVKEVVEEVQMPTYGRPYGKGFFPANWKEEMKVADQYWSSSTGKYVKPFESTVEKISTPVVKEVVEEVVKRPYFNNWNTNYVQPIRQYVQPAYQQYVQQPIRNYVQQPVRNYVRPTYNNNDWFNQFLTMWAITKDDDE